ncbi:MAG: UDP-N-acetylenolpyruvoylglucosamine reductase [Candidatus Raymondbacteria bacterium RifOxyA12_full_50_37]|nr:MAG: UDP-N-acetylenolpyruvoylglucosamine reductase [Candidatus Raymondbacteria bacterium RifOxyA12_full_50_37]OGJ94499.1 MAG: UDP-N-acetylenolpyruvoylglucosamine reductase [Candidatus Raymondbacteria bacterium RifOxyB12_full_50_8]OGJ95259.1 MAG: UDP-N-acetylenolpyruvoylglucosamine reductase [Candidatus Raymondbacteria bacterium RIFOXYC2_FULL_50_21]OGP39501.1 MAG: UDP-N-acetylenolpyruvoylglucosamine reductase [Candidatus Raymondbacteria bacterium RIFOXYB2_FULL_49_35]
MDPRFSLEQNVSLKDRCTYRTGGSARYFARPLNTEELGAAVAYAAQTAIPWFVLGKGSNVLISDAGYNGLVISMEKFNTIAVDAPLGAVRAQAGAELQDLVARCCESGLKGLELLNGIPGSVGGGVYMNAGAFDASISDCLDFAVSLTATGVCVTRQRADIEFAYRSSTFQHNKEIVLEAGFQLTHGHAAELSAIARSIEQRRRDRQPCELPSCGSVFKRPPPGGYAGALIEQAGLKGRRIGGMRVSEKHANFIVNDGTGSSADVHALIDLVQKTVFDCCGVLLEPEVIFLGDFNG